MIRRNQQLQALLGAEISKGYYGDLERKAGAGPDCTGRSWPVWCICPGVCWSQGLSDLVWHLLEDGSDLRPGGAGPL